MEYPNIYYKQLADRVIQNTSLRLKKEKCVSMKDLQNPLRQR